MPQDPLTTDVLVAGGGPAGLAAAIAARQKGFSVIVVDAAHPPIDKACGEGLLPGGVRALGQLGVSLAARDYFPLRGIRFLDGRNSASADFSHGMGLGVRRTALHRVLMERAAEAGISILWGARVQPAGDGPVAVSGRTARYRWLVGADGVNSRVRHWAGLDRGRRSSLRFGFRGHFKIAPWTDYVEVHWGPRSQLFVTPVNVEEVCVALLSRNPQARLAGEIPSFSKVARRLEGASPTSVERGGITMSRRLSVVARDRVALTGDASGSVDAITGEGLSLAFQQALALAEALEMDDLRIYQAAHRRIMCVPSFAARWLVAMDRRQWLRRRALRALAAEPGVFSQLLASHAGSAPSRASDARRALALGWLLVSKGT